MYVKTKSILHPFHIDDDLKKASGCVYVCDTKSILHPLHIDSHLKTHQDVYMYHVISDGSLYKRCVIKIILSLYIRIYTQINIYVFTQREVMEVGRGVLEGYTLFLEIYT